jgi:hypothetical protein
MKAALGAFTAALLAGAIFVQPAHAQPAPQGSYLGSCTHVRMHGDRLVAQCRRINGAWDRTALDVAGCSGDIANLNGHLSCNRATREGYGSSDWRGRRDEHPDQCSRLVNEQERERCWRGW